MTSRHRPTAHELDELAAAWDAYRDDEADYDRFAEAIRRVLGRGKSRAMLALESAVSVRLDELPMNPGPFTFDDGK